MYALLAAVEERQVGMSEDKMTAIRPTDAYIISTLHLAVRIFEGLSLVRPPIIDILNELAARLEANPDPEAKLASLTLAELAAEDLRFIAHLCCAERKNFSTTESVVGRGAKWAEILRRAAAQRAQEEQTQAAPTGQKESGNV